jgi:DNA-binding FrmR family transcriptional regulator
MALPGYNDDKGTVLARLKRIEGQTRGIHKMVEDDRYCVEVLQQISAVTRALQGVALHLLDEHLSHCVAEAVKTGGEEKDVKLREASAAIARLVKS